MAASHALGVFDWLSGEQQSKRTTHVLLAWTPAWPRMLINRNTSQHAMHSGYYHLYLGRSRRLPGRRRRERQTGPIALTTGCSCRQRAIVCTRTIALGPLWRSARVDHRPTNVISKFLSITLLSMLRHIVGDINIRQRLRVWKKIHTHTRTHIHIYIMSQFSNENNLNSRKNYFIVIIKSFTRLIDFLILCGEFGIIKL